MKSENKICALLALLAALLIALLMLAGCATPKNSSLDAQQSDSLLLKYLSASTDSLKFAIWQNRQETLERISNLKIEERNIYYSAPDSTGRQHMTQERTVTTMQQDRTVQSLQSQLTASYEELNARIDTLYGLVKTMATRKEQSVELSWWDLHKDKVYGALIVALLALFLWQKLKKA